jgi:hypothetical protein
VVDRESLDRSVTRIILAGLQAGYPSCCVYQFANDSYMEEAAEYMTLDEETVATLREYFHVADFPAVVRMVYSGKMRRGPEGDVRCWDCLDKVRAAATVPRDHTGARES